MLKMNDVKLDLISDTDMYQFIEKGMSRGVNKLDVNTIQENNVNI